MNAYFCSTYYHILITVLKNVDDRGKNDIYIMDLIPTAKELYTRIQGTGIFKKTYLLETPASFKDKNTFQKLFWKKIAKKHISATFHLSTEQYDELFIFMDDTWLAHYFKIFNIKYNLIEDSLNSFKFIKNTVYYRMVDKSANGWLYKVWKIFPWGEGNYQYFFDSPCVKSIEVNEKKGTIFEDRDHVIEVPRQCLLDKLNNEDVQLLVSSIFIDDLSALKIDNIAIIFTSPFYDDKIISSEKEQYELYERLIKGYVHRYNVLIKPHPRDIVNYSSIPEIRVLPSSFPSELLNYIVKGKVKKYVSIASHCVDIYPREMVDFFSLEEAKRKLYD